MPNLVPWYLEQFEIQSKNFLHLALLVLLGTSPLRVRVVLQRGGCLLLLVLGTQESSYLPSAIFSIATEDPGTLNHHLSKKISPRPTPPQLKRPEPQPLEPASSLHPTTKHNKTTDNTELTSWAQNSQRQRHLLW